MNAAIIHGCFFFWGAPQTPLLFMSVGRLGGRAHNTAYFGKISWMERTLNDERGHCPNDGSGHYLWNERTLNDGSSHYPNDGSGHYL